MRLTWRYIAWMAYARRAAIVTASDLASCLDAWSAHVVGQKCKPWCSGPMPHTWRSFLTAAELA
jgi:hypothetical protein